MYVDAVQNYQLLQSHVKVVSETENVRSFIDSQSGSKSVSQEQTSCLFFNGTKFHLTQKVSTEEGQSIRTFSRTKQRMALYL